MMSLPLGTNKAAREAALPQFASLSGSPPPYYEADAYPRVRARRALRPLFSVPVGLLTAILVCIVWLGFYSNRQGNGRSERLPLAVEQSFSHISLKQFETSLGHCAAIRTFPQRIEPSSRKTNPRWNDVSGQKDTIVLRNATLFDGETFLPDSVDIVFSKGIIISVSKARSDSSRPLVSGATELELHGQYVTPGLVDMHSHHLVGAWPSTGGGDPLEDANEVHADFGPLTPFLRAVDGMKAYDPGARYIAAGGVTSSLIIPGSANIMGGEGAPVKNIPRSGPHHEYVVEEILLEHGIPVEERLRYMKMACGENPKRVYGHTRMGNVWIFRKQLARAKELLEKQDAWCEGAVSLSSEGERKAFIEAMGSFPVDLELDSTVGMLRGRVALHNHCYEPEDMETMLRVSHEFGFRVRAFHHAISAWLVPEMLKEYGENVTIATFAEYGLYKREAYQASLRAGKILSDHGVPVAYKSDHFGEDSNARWLLLQAAVGHSFHLPAEKALQAVTSVPAAAIELDYRIGYLRPGYDADIVIWDAHPLSIGATPRQVYIDGIATLDPVKVEGGFPPTAQESSDAERGVAKPPMRAEVPLEERRDLCEKAQVAGRSFIISGIKKSFLDNYPEIAVNGEQGDGDLTLVISAGVVACLGYGKGCAQAASQVTEDATVINLTNGHLSPGLTAVTTSLGLLEVAMEAATGDGVSIPMTNVRDPSNVNYAKYGVSIEGKGIARARIGGVTRAITPPFTYAGLVRGVSTGFRTGNDNNLLNGGIFQPDVALHINLGEEAKAVEGTESRALYELRQLLTSYRTKEDDSAYASVIKGSLPLVIHAQSVV